MSTLEKAMPFKLVHNGVEILCPNKRNLLAEARPLAKKGFFPSAYILIDGEWKSDGSLDGDIDNLPHAVSAPVTRGSLVAKSALKELAALALALAPLAGKRALTDEEKRELGDAVVKAGVAIGSIELSKEEDDESEEEEVDERAETDSLIY